MQPGSFGAAGGLNHEPANSSSDVLSSRRHRGLGCRQPWRQWFTSHRDRRCGARRGPDRACSGRQHRFRDRAAGKRDRLRRGRQRRYRDSGRVYDPAHYRCDISPGGAAPHRRGRADRSRGNSVRRSPRADAPCHYGRTAASGCGDGRRACGAARRRYNGSPGAAATNRPGRLDRSNGSSAGGTSDRTDPNRDHGRSAASRHCA